MPSTFRQWDSFTTRHNMDHNLILTNSNHHDAQIHQDYYGK
jgi:hypothetical protein